MQDVSLTELDFFVEQEALLPLYLNLRAAFLGLAPTSEVQVHKTTISFRAPRPFVYVSILPKSRAGVHSRLCLSFSSDTAKSHPLIIDSVFIRRALYTIHAHVPTSGLIDQELLELIRFSRDYRYRKEDNK